MKKILLIIICLLLTSCSKSPNKPTEDIVQEVNNNIRIDFIGYYSNHNVRLSQFQFHYNIYSFNEISVEGDEVYLVWPYANQKIVLDKIIYDDNFNEKYESIPLYNTNEPFIIICNQSELHPNIRITVNDKYSFSPSISQVTGEFEHLEFTEPFDWDYDDKLYDENIEVINELVGTTFDFLVSDNYSITMEEAGEFLLITSSYMNPVYVGYDGQIFFETENRIPLSVIENWAIILFSDYTGDLPISSEEDYLSFPYKSFEAINEYKLLDIKNKADI